MNKHSIIIMHGTGGSPKGNWFPWLKRQMRAKGYNVCVPQFPTPEDQSLINWHTKLAEKAPRCDKDTILIGHSCGAAFMLHILELLNEPVAQSIFVSGFIDKLGNEYFDNLNETFVNRNFDWAKIRQNAGKITILHGDNDPYVPMAAAQRLADGLQTEITVIPNGGHLNAEFGYIEFPEILEVLK